MNAIRIRHSRFSFDFNVWARGWLEASPEFTEDDLEAYDYRLENIHYF